VQKATIKKGSKKFNQDATSQLVDHFMRYKAGVDRYGMVALDISVVANPQSAYLVVDSIGTLVREVDTLFERFHAEFESALRYHRDKRILGILLFAKILGYHTAENRHITKNKIGLTPDKLRERLDKHRVTIALAVSRLRTVTFAYAIPPVGITPSQRTVFTVKRRTIFSVSSTL
jgi:hypothetical protein